MRKLKIDFDQVVLAFAVGSFLLGVWCVTAWPWLCGLFVTIACVMILALWGKILIEDKNLHDESTD